MRLCEYLCYITDKFYETGADKKDRVVMLSKKKKAD